MYINMAQQNQRTDLWGRKVPKSRFDKAEKEGYVVKKAAPAKKDMRCPHCNYVWTPRIEDPKQCPRCKRYLYVPSKKED